MGESKDCRKSRPSAFQRAARRIKRNLVHRFCTLPSAPRILAFVVGCQRSGTTMLMECFQKDLRAKCFGENSAFTNHPGKSDDSHRLKSFDDIERILGRERARLIVTKPLVDSQNTVALLDRFPASRAVWMFRHYKDVVNSYIVKWGDDMPKKNLRVLVSGDRPDHWMSENAADGTRAVARSHFSEEVPPQDSAALFWYVRNMLFLDLGLHEDARVLPCDYDDLVSAPESAMRGMYGHLGVEYPGGHVIDHIHARSVRRGKDVEISAPIEQLCVDLLARLAALRPETAPCEST